MWAGQVSGVLLLEQPASLPLSRPMVRSPAASGPPQGDLEEAPKRQVSGPLGDLDVETAVCDPYMSPSLATWLATSS